MPTAERDPAGRAAAPRGCLATGLGAAALALLAPFVVAMRGWRTRRRGPDIRSTVEVASVEGCDDGVRTRIDLSLDVPPPAEPGFTHRLTDVVVRMAEGLRRPDDAYHLVYRLPWDEEPVVLPLGPQLQELGERFSLVQSQGAMAGRTAVWLALGRDQALAQVVDPATYDPEAAGEPDALLARPDVRWSMASEWARVGPSLVIRLILVVPSATTDRVTNLLESLIS